MSTVLQQRRAPRTVLRSFPNSSRWASQWRCEAQRNLIILRIQACTNGSRILKGYILSLTVSGVQTVTAPSSSQEKEKEKLSDGDVAGPVGEPEKSHSNSSTLSDRRPSDSSLCSIEEEHRYVYEMVHAILLSTRENVNFVNEVFHQVHFKQKWYKPLVTLQVF